MPALAAAVILLFSSVNVVNKRLNLKTLEVSKHHQTETPDTIASDNQYKANLGCILYGRVL